MAKTAAEFLAEAEAAYTRALEAESYGIGNRSLSRTTSEAALKQVLYWRAAVAREARGGIRVRLGTPT